MNPHRIAAASRPSRLCGGACIRTDFLPRQYRAIRRLAGQIVVAARTFGGARAVARRGTPG